MVNDVNEQSDTRSRGKNWLYTSCGVRGQFEIIGKRYTEEMMFNWSFEKRFLYVVLQAEISPAKAKRILKVHKQNGKYCHLVKLKTGHIKRRDCGRWGWKGGAGAWLLFSAVLSTGPFLRERSHGVFPSRRITIISVWGRLV